MSDITAGLSKRFFKYMDEKTIELSINQPGEVWVDREGSPHMQRIEAPELDLDTLKLYANSIAATNKREINRKHPLLNGTLDTGERVQVIMPPACISSQFIFSMRRQIYKEIKQETLLETNYYKNSHVVIDSLAYRKTKMDNDPVFQLCQDGRFMEAMIKAVGLRQSIVICGQMASGKTAFASSLLLHLPTHDRVASIEDDQELVFIIPNVVRLLADETTTTYNGIQLFKACNRLRLNRIFIGEIRLELIVPFFDSLMTFCKGNITTCHGEDPEMAKEYLTGMYRKTNEGKGLTPGDVRRMIHSLVDVMFFIDYDGTIRQGGAVYFPKYDLNI